MEIFGFITGILYLILEIKQNKYMWVVNLLSAIAYAVVFAQSSLYAAMALQIYYVLLSFYGFWQWQRDKKRISLSFPTDDSVVKSYKVSTVREATQVVKAEVSTVREANGEGNAEVDAVGQKAGDGIVYRKLSGRVLVASGAAFGLMFVCLLTFLRNMTGDPMPVADAFCTSLSIVAMVWLSKSFIHQWLLWILIDAVYVGLFIYQGLYPTALLYFIYTLSAVYGYFHWKRSGVLLSAF